MSAATPARLLIVDDEVPQMKALCDTLREHGYATAGFGSPTEALSALRNQKFDLLLTDLGMPGMDGIELLRQAKELDGNLAAVVMTGHGTINTAVQAMKSGALDYILKPFELSAVLPVLARALDIRRLRLENERLNDALRKRQAELERANQELETFSYSVSHDLRAPLRGIDGFSLMLLQAHGDSLSPDARRLLDKVRASTQRMQRLIDDLLNFSRLGRQPLSKKTVSMSEFVGDVLEELQSERESRNVEVQVGALPDCLADPALLRQVLINLLANAFKFTRGREPALIQVGGENRPDGQEYFVRDNGAGFDMKHAQKLFGVFQRLHTTDAFEGTGIGLSIVRQIIQRHGGKTWAEGKVGEGATIYFSLPAE